MANKIIDNQSNFNDAIHNTEVLNAVEIKTHKVVTRGIFLDIVKGLSHSRWMQAFIGSALSVAILFSAVAIVSAVIGGPTPPLPPWAIAVAAAGGFTIVICKHLPFNGLQDLKSEIAYLKRLTKQDYNRIITIKNKNGKKVKIFLGSLPSRLNSLGENLVNDQNVGAVCSINEPWEREFLISFTGEDWKELGVDYHKMDVLDHTLLDDDLLNEGADYIHRCVEEGKNVFVHCRAGKGRSAMLIAAYLIKYRNFTVSDAVERIKKKRPCSTIRDKQQRLEEFKNPPTMDYETMDLLLAKNEYFFAKDLNGQEGLIFKDRKGQLRCLHDPRNFKEQMKAMLTENNFSRELYSTIPVYNKEKKRPNFHYVSDSLVASDIQN